MTCLWCGGPIETTPTTPLFGGAVRHTNLEECIQYLSTLAIRATTHANPKKILLEVGEKMMITNRNGDVIEIICGLITERLHITVNPRA